MVKPDWSAGVHCFGITAHRVNINMHVLYAMFVSIIVSTVDAPCNIPIIIFGYYVGVP